MSRAIGVSLFALLVASSAQAQQVGDVFYIALENHNFTQPSTVTGINQIKGNSAAPFINSLVTPGNANAAQTSFAGNYQNVAPGVHPSEPNYVWQEAGLHGPLNDNDPFPANVVNAPNLSALLAAKGKTWRSYQEDTDLVNTNGNNINGDHGAGVAPTNTVAPKSQYETPLTSFSGASASYTNPYNGSDQYNYAAKHNPQVFFNATNGGNDPTSANSQAQNYAPLQQLSTDLSNNTVAKYNWITPDQYNDMHSALNTNFTYNGVTYAAGSDEEQIALGDNFLSIIVPEIEASQAYKNNGMIVIWNDETEGDEDAGSTAGFDGTEIIISPLAKGNAYTNNILYTHSSDLATLQNIFGVAGGGAGGYLGGAGGANSLADLFKPGAIPSAVPEPSTWVMMGLGFAGLAGLAGYRRKLGVAAKPAAALLNR
jgi:phosphatidylinositol-3-phosphatase